jgi:hypothetical protein
MHDWNRRTLRPQPSHSFAGILWALLSVCFAIGFSPHARAGSILREVYQGIQGNFVSDMTNNPIYPNSPTQTNFVTDLFESPTNFDDNYGQRMHGYIVPPVTGAYTFWIATDDNGLLFLSTGAGLGERSGMDQKSRTAIGSCYSAGGQTLLY